MSSRTKLKAYAKAVPNGFVVRLKFLPKGKCFVSVALLQFFLNVKPTKSFHMIPLKLWGMDGLPGTNCSFCKDYKSKTTYILGLALGIGLTFKNSWPVWVPTTLRMKSNIIITNSISISRTWQK